MNRKKSGFIRQACGGLVRQMCGGLTLVEALITLAIISMMVGLLLPALSKVRKAAKEAKQRAQLTTIELALVGFKNDYGDYPPSSAYFCPPPVAYVNNYCGAQKLTEALLGWDLMGFHPKSAWTYDGSNSPCGGGSPVYVPTDPCNLRERKGPYLELATANAFRLGISAAGDGLFVDMLSSSSLYPSRDRYLICDVFGVKKIILAGKTALAGMPILYYKANTSSKSLDNSTGQFPNLIYNVIDNFYLTDVKEKDDRNKHGTGTTRIWNPLWDTSDNFVNFYNYITDPKVTTIRWPYRPDSYILISAGADSFYGTKDDICNFGY